MSSHAASQPSAESDVPAVLGPVVDQLQGREEHCNAPAGRVAPQDVPDVLGTLKNESGLDHLACVTAQQYPDRYETIYHLRDYDDPTREASIVVPVASGEPQSTSAAGVFRTADWHEREAYDLVGITYDDHPDLRRILLPKTWQGHPLSLDYDQDQSQIVPLREQDGSLHDQVAQEG